VRDVHHMGLGASVLCESYLPYLQQPWNPLMIAIRTEGEPASYAAEVRRAVASLDPSMPLPEIEPLPSLVAATTSDIRAIVSLLGAFAAAALALAALGLYGTLSYTVARRSREIGIRVALGEPLRQVRNLVVRQGLSLTALGAAAGCAASFALNRFLAGHVFGVKAADPAALASVAFLLLLVALVSCWIPAHRASRIDPITALRME
jgi:putative ABC transport system permease protein